MARHVVMLSWRDTSNPEGGGAEVYLETVAAGLRAQGDRVTIFTAAFPGARARETRAGIDYVRRGGKLTVYLWGLLFVLLGRLGPLGRADLVVDVQNGIPFFSRLVTRRPVLVLVHHCHHEQWPVVYPGLSGRIGWWLESRLSPWLYREDQYVTVSGASRDELVALGVAAERITVVHNGTHPPAQPSVESRSAEPTCAPSICVVGRLVPHKRVELAIDAAAALRDHHPDLRLTIVGSGWWEDALREYAACATVPGTVEFLGHVEEETRDEVYARSWVMALPSLKEGWGLVVTEAGRCGTPTVAFGSAGGTQESIDDGESGILVDDADGFVAALDRVLADEILRKELAEGARWHAARHSWEQAQTNFAAVVDSVLRGDRVAVSD